MNYIQALLTISTGVLDREGNARKVVNCSCVVVKDWGEESQERSILLNYFQTEQ
jgi:small subunit ribosomal protein S12e